MTAKELAAWLRFMAGDDRGHGAETLRVAATALDRLHAIETASGDLAEIEMRIAQCVADRCIMDESQAIEDMRALLAGLKRERADREAERKLAICTFCGHISKKTDFVEHMRKCLAHPLSDKNDVDGYLAAWIALKMEAERMTEAVWGLLCIADGLSELVRVYRAEDCPFAQSEQVKRAEQQHGHIVEKGAGK